MFNAMLMRSRNKKGFTLMEMLIVVAIIAILVAVSFPVFTSQLEKAKTATDDANMRAAKAVAVATYLTDEGTGIGFFDADKGIIAPLRAGIVPYGKSGTLATVGDANGKVIEIVYRTPAAPVEGEFAYKWVA